MPAFPEIGYKHIYEKAMKLPGLSDYFPSKMAKGRTIDKVYFYNVFNNIYPDEVTALIIHANSKRYTVENDTVAENSIVMTEEWAN